MESKKEGFFDRLSDIFNLSIYNPIELIKNSFIYGIIKAGVSLGLKISLILLSLKISGINFKYFLSDYFSMTILNGDFNINGNIDINNSIFGNINIENSFLPNNIRILFSNMYDFINLYRFSLPKIGFNLIFFLLILVVLLIINSLLESTNIKILVESNKKNKIDYLEANKYVFERKIKLILFDFIFKYLIYALFILIGILIISTRINRIDFIFFIPGIFLAMIFKIIYSNYINFLKVNLIISDKGIKESLVESNKKIKEMKISNFIKKLFFIICICIGIDIVLSSVITNMPLINGVIDIVITIISSAYFILISNNNINKNLEYIEIKGKV